MQSVMINRILYYSPSGGSFGGLSRNVHNWWMVNTATTPKVIAISIRP